MAFNEGLIPAGGCGSVLAERASSAAVMIFAGDAGEFAVGCTYMESKTLRTGLFAGLVAIAGIAPLMAELPSLEEKPWYGYFAGIVGKKVAVGLDTDGGAVIIPIKNREWMTTQNYIPLNYQIEEVLPNGKTAVKKIDFESLTSTSAATVKPGVILFTGKTDGDVKFEGYFEVSRGVVFVGGRILDKGTVTNPLKFTVQAIFPQAYKNAKKGEKEWQKKVEDDKLEVRLADGKRAKSSGKDTFDATAGEFSGPISQLEMEISEFGDGKFSFTASPNSKMTITNPKISGPFYEGITVTWEADPATDPQGKARLAIDLK